jgi:multimeric flavodoxin WrbA
MKVVALNCSPAMDDEDITLILKPFLEGMKEAGADVELFHAGELNIEPCQNKLNCWLKTPGECSIEDDMQMLQPKLSEADIWVFATPVYLDGMSGQMKNLLGRTAPLIQSFFELRDGHSRRTPRQTTKRGKMVLVSKCDFWEMDNFDPLLAHLKAFCDNIMREFAGALLRPHGGGLKWLSRLGVGIEDIFQAAKEAGRQLIEDGAMSPETLRTVSRELLPIEQYVQIANKRFQQTLDELEKNNPQQ